MIIVVIIVILLLLLLIIIIKTTIFWVLHYVVYQMEAIFKMNSAASILQVPWVVWEPQILQVLLLLIVK